MITSDNPNLFKSASFIYGKVKRDLHSFDSANLIDEGEFPRYIDHVLSMLGVGVLKEQDAMLSVRNYKAKLPAGFQKLYSAHKCSPYINKSDLVHQQGAPISVYNDVTWELLKGGENCEIEVVQKDERIIESITVRQYVKESQVNIGYANPVLLRLAPNVRKDDCAEWCANIGSDCPYEISIRNGVLYTNFAEDSVYIKYYENAKDEDRVPMIPDVEEVEKAIEWYSKYELLMGWWINNQVPDLQNRWQYAEVQFNKWMGEARYERKLPSFLRMVDKARLDRINNHIMLFAR